MSKHFAEIFLADLQECPTNTRRRFGGLDELTESIREKGILQPILVRKAEREGRFEIVIGARRCKAAAKAGLRLIPSMIRELTDVEVLELQLIENAQRDDIHPIEEAEGYERLMQQHGRTVEEIAAKVSKSESTIRARLKLLALCEKVREGFFEEEISPSIALLIARIPSEKLQLQAFKEVRGSSYRTAQKTIERDFTLRLRDAPWKLDDAELSPSAGSCKDCLMRTGNQREMFSDIDSPEVCTSPGCYGEKKRLWIKVARRAGRKILTGKKAEEARYNRSDLIRISDPEYAHPKHRSHKQITGKHLAEEEIVLVEDKWSGQLQEYAPLKAVSAAKRAAGWKPPKRTMSGTSHKPVRTAQQKNADAKRDLKNLIAYQSDHEVIEATMAAAAAERGGLSPGTKVPGPVLCYTARVLLDRLYLDSDDEIVQRMLERRLVTVPMVKGQNRIDYHKAEKALDDWISRESSFSKLLGLVVELVMIEHAADKGGHSRGTTLGRGGPDRTVDLMAEAFLVEPQAVRKGHADRVGSYLKALPQPKRSSSRKKKAAAKPSKKTAAKKDAKKKAPAKTTTQAKTAKKKKAARRKATTAPPTKPPGPLCRKCGWSP